MAFQLAAVTLERDGTTSMLDEQGVTAPAEAEVVTTALVGVASNGGDLGRLLTLPDLADYEFDRIVTTQLQDVGRQAASIERGIRPKITHYVRAVNLPACGRCIILAGSSCGSETPFQRHPNCDCRGVPTTANLADTFTTDPMDAFNRLSKEDREKSFTKAGVDAIRAGADPGQVVRARRGMTSSQGSGETAQIRLRRLKNGTERLEPRTSYSSRGHLVRNEDGLYTTTEGVWQSKTGRVRGIAGKAMQRAGMTGPRLMPESIAELATDPADHIRLLRAYGYIL